MEDNRLPPFLSYDGVSSGNEAIQDFILSWTIKCADEKYSGFNPLLHEYARRIVYVLTKGGHNEKDDRYKLGIDISDLSPKFKVRNVKVCRQFKNIDLLAKFDIEGEGIFILNIENKFYSDVREGQLESGVKALQTHYKNLKYELINLIIHCDEEIIFNERKGKALRDRFKEAGYKFPDIYTIAKLAGLKGEQEVELTNNYLFDEYWFRGYRDKLSIPKCLTP
jgi:hypothetical protein